MFQRDSQLVSTDAWMTDVYTMGMRVVVPREPAEVNIATTSDSLQLWYECLGQQDKHHVQKVLEWMEINISMAETGGFCDGCVLGKVHRKPFTPQSNRSQIFGELINANVNRPMPVKSLRGAKYYACFKDNCSKYRRGFFIKEKNEVSKCSRMFLNEVSTAGHR
jgi:hypothetical protein